VSARKHLAGDRAAGRMEPLLQHLARSLTEDRGRVLLDNAAAEGLRAAGYLKQNLGVKRSAFELSLAELTERVEKVRSHLSATKDNLERLHDKIRSEGDAIKARVRLDVEQFAERFQRAIIGEIDKADAHDVKRYLPLYIQDKFKEWAELEGEACAELLERLAEEAITVTNENARAATAAVAERLGPTDARFQVDVDTFRYAVSVYAVGALGTTVFLFVNTLVGGVLTLAAPILAIVLHSRAAAEIKDQAMEKAPEAIRQAAALMRPHFERLVNEFVTRLGDFVTAAGDKLYRGITEVLDQAIAERRARGDAVAPLAARGEAGAPRPRERGGAAGRGGRGADRAPVRPRGGDHPAPRRSVEVKAWASGTACRAVSTSSARSSSPTPSATTWAARGRWLRAGTTAPPSPRSSAPWPTSRTTPPRDTSLASHACARATPSGRSTRWRARGSCAPDSPRR